MASKKNLPRISQSLMKDLRDKKCPHAIFREYVLGERNIPSEVMVRGNYFEHFVLGATRDGTVPEIPRLKNGDLSKPERDLIDLIGRTKPLMEAMGITVQDKQVEVIAGDLIGHIDAYIGYQGRDAILDLKYTETQEDDKWNGWGDLARVDHTQAMHYTYLHHELTGDWLPFYYLIVGKSGWVKWVRIIATVDGMNSHERFIEWSRERMKELHREKWKATPEFNRCNSCDFKDSCEHRATIPSLQTVRV